VSDSRMKDLQRHRQGSKVFAGKHGFITARDLFRWAERHGNGYEELARDGYMLLAERLRNSEEKEVVQRVLEKHMRVKLDVNKLHDMEASETFEAVKKLAESPEHVSTFGRIVWTKSMKRLFNLVEHCIRHCEPVLLVGETGCGKTMVCQLLALLHNQRLHILNCHQHSETSDFLGGLRPVRDRDSLAIKFQKASERIISLALFREVSPNELPVKIEDSGTTLTMVKNALSGMSIYYYSISGLHPLYLLFSVGLQISCFWNMQLMISCQWPAFHDRSQVRCFKLYLI
jgi:midasin